jgi:glutamine amidotransferase
MKKKINIIDLGIGNINSISKCIHFLGFNYEIIQDPINLNDDCKIIFPGVGNFHSAMKIMNDVGWTNKIKYEVTENKKFFLGICLGMQLMATKSFENDKESNGLNLINAEVVNLKKLGCELKTPHTGWNSINIKKKEKSLYDISDKSDLYFNHNYVFEPKNENVILTTTTHQIEFVSMINFNNIYGMQFHPEKSGNNGKKLLNNFLQL